MIAQSETADLTVVQTVGVIDTNCQEGKSQNVIAKEVVFSQC